MPASKHRRRGKQRPRLRQELPRELVVTPKGRRILELIRERLTELYGDREWTEDELAEAMAQLHAEGKIPDLV